MGPYLIKTAETSEELIESFRLRHEVFNQEFRGMTRAGLDFDKFDYQFDHLIIVYKETNKIIGTYRLNCSSHSKASYTSMEFELNSIFLSPGPHLELGRACIHKNFRKGSVITLLWRGIAEYMNLSNASILFGCSSVKINTPREAAMMYMYLIEKDHVAMDYFCAPTFKYQMNDFEAWFLYFNKGLNEEQRSEVEMQIPSLLKSYLKLGAKIAGQPAFDKEFNCIDFLTILKKENLSRSLADKFQVNR